MGWRWWWCCWCVRVLVLLVVELVQEKDGEQESTPNQDCCAHPHFCHPLQNHSTKHASPFSHHHTFANQPRPKQCQRRYRRRRSCSIIAGCRCANSCRHPLPCFLPRSMLMMSGASGAEGWKEPTVLKRVCAFLLAMRWPPRRAHAHARLDLRRPVRGRRDGGQFYSMRVASGQ